MRRGLVSLTWPLVVLGVSSICPPPARAQVPTDSASLAARAFYDAIGARRWDAVSGLVHSELVGMVRRNVGMMVNADTSGLVLAELLGLPDRAAFERASGADILARLLRTLERRIEPLARVISTNEVEVIGALPDGDDAHVVVRVTPYADGSRPTWIRVLTVRRDGGPWRVTDAEELTSVITAVLGLPLRSGPGTHVQSWPAMQCLDVAMPVPRAEGGTARGARGSSES